MPDPATREPFAAVQQRIGGQERPLKRLADVDVSRRKLLVSATALSGLAVGGAALPANLRKMMAATPRDLRGRLSDIEHIVILMQENRSFDHYFGTMPGVRGFQDPTAITLPGGKSVFYQPDPTHADGYLTPFHYDTKSTSAQQTPGTDHSWGTQHQAWDNGAMDQWVAAKGEYTMGYFTQPDIPFHWALAQAFTVCDNYHCSVLGPTNPNRLYMWSGMLDPNGTGGGPVTDDSPAFNNAYLSWTTYPERLEAAGVSWQVYQEEDNYDDNALAWFKQFSNAPTSSPLWQRGMRKRPAGWFEADARAGRLPQVSWLVAPTAQTEHPDYFPAAGAEYIASKLDAIAANEDLWRSTLFILCYDENDGMFDHVPPPVPPAGTTNEFVDGAADRPRLPGPGDRRVSLVRGRLCLLRRARPHVADPPHRGPLRRDRAQHQRLAPRRLRRLHHSAAPARRARPLAVAEPGGQPGRRRGRLPHRPAGSVRQPGPDHPGGQ